jgi:16S rRNA processing protein RimM
MDNGVQSIFRIAPVAEEGAKAPERLIPYVDQYVKSIDLAAKKITVDWGLDY